jgi:hypothetical protein
VVSCRSSCRVALRVAAYAPDAPDPRQGRVRWRERPASAFLFAGDDFGACSRPHAKSQGRPWAISAGSGFHVARLRYRDVAPWTRYRG